ncbi:MAG: transglycosylase SLT domain-containing protein [Bacteroidota bacterium]
MLKFSTAVSIAFLAAISGCTPPGESLIRKGHERGSARAEQGDLSVASLSSLDGPTQAILQAYGGSIREHAREYGFDWRLVLAVMKQESRFSPEAESHKGAEGLMQIMPRTGEEITKALSIEDIDHPHQNIRAGVYYLSRLYQMFENVPEGDRIRLTLAAYNAGIGRVYDAQVLAAYLQDNPTKWQSVRDALPLLSKRYYTLHASVWKDKRPEAGWFGSSGQTIAYVERVMDYYEDYRAVLN